ncbi:hypothetical protein MYAM1_003172 [Malassezia yamatoensis]|uniref:DUF218 domain-containing protein n=1 Tax=Malassezia yamatoensis TaxID=253288 RepID=A0AAJ6CHL9_9BASI|nr:hypothetical protein MYAM1_003172 [Malassezia yamatoensis]
MSLPHMYADLQGKLADRGVWSSIQSRLAARSRVTNLGVVMMTFALVVSLMLNMRHTTRIVHVPVAQSSGVECPERFGNVRSVLPVLPGYGKVKLTHLVMVAGHAVWKGDPSASITDENNWFLEEYQRNGSVNTFLQHIETGLGIAANDSASLLVFSGGQTREHAWLSEAESYLRLALHLSSNLPKWPQSALAATKSKSAFQPLFSDAAPTAAASASSPEKSSESTPNLSHLRMTTENFALDSFENLLFSIARFREYTGTYPETVTIVGYQFKEKRFRDLHARALRWPMHKPTTDGTSRFNYIGIDDANRTNPLERDNAYHLFLQDLYGCHHRLLEKRRKRNSARRLPPYTSTASEMAGLLDWCPADNSALQGLYPFWLPWDPRVNTGMGRGAQLIMEQNGGHIQQDEILPDGKKIVT